MADRETCTGAQQRDIRLACVLGFGPANFPQSSTRHTASVRQTGNTTYGERALPLSRKLSIDDTSSQPHLAPGSSTA